MHIIIRNLSQWWKLECIGQTFQICNRIISKKICCVDTTAYIAHYYNATYYLIMLKCKM